jgi:tetratricopeptide (TPR) repeat protein
MKTPLGQVLRKPSFYGSPVALLMLLSACAAPASQLPAAPPPAQQQQVVPQTTPNLATPNAPANQRIEAARAALNARNYALAVTEALEAVKADGASSSTHYALGNAYNQSGTNATDAALRTSFFNNAVSAYQQALAINANNADAQHNLGTVFLQLNRIDEARAAMEAALRIDPADAKSHYMLGAILVQDTSASSAQSQARAEQEFLTALQSNANMAEAQIGLAQIALNKGDPKKALDYAQKGVQLSGATVDPFSYWLLAQAQCKSGDKAGGSQTLEKVRAANIPDPQFNQQVLELTSSCK